MPTEESIRAEFEARHHRLLTERSETGEYRLLHIEALWVSFQQGYRAGHIAGFSGSITSTHEEHK